MDNQCGGRSTCRAPVRRLAAAVRLQGSSTLITRPSSGSISPCCHGHGPTRTRSQLFVIRNAIALGREPVPGGRE